MWKLLKLLLLLVVGPSAFVLGWLAHGWICMRRNACILWRRLDAREWTEKLKDDYLNGRYERPSSGAVPIEAALDEAARSGVPSTRRDTPSAETKLESLRRKT